MSRYHGDKEFWQQPRSVTPQMVKDADAFVADVERLNPPCQTKQDIEWLSLRAGAFLCHYFIALSDIRLNAIVAADWLTMLREFPPHAIENAIQHWIKHGTYKPKPAEIRELCIDHFPRDVWTKLERARAVKKMRPTAPDSKNEKQEWTPPTPEQKEAVSRMLQAAGLKRINVNENQEEEA